MEKLRLSYSQINMFLDKPLAWELSHVKGVKVPLSIPLFVGGTFHLTYHLYYSNKIERTTLLLEDCIDIGASLWDTRAFSSKENKDIIWETANQEEEKSKFLALVSAYYPLASRTIPTAVEQEFSREIIEGELELHGFIDLIDDRGTPIDLKTTARLPYGDKLLWDMQPTTYATILGADTLPSFIYHYVIKTGIPYTKILKTSRDKIMMDWFRDILLPGVASLMRNGVYVCDMTKCRSCDYYLFGKCGPR